MVANMIIVTMTGFFARADRIIFMADGEVLVDTTVDDFFDNPLNLRAQQFSKINHESDSKIKEWSP